MRLVQKIKDQLFRLNVIANRRELVRYLGKEPNNAEYFIAMCVRTAKGMFRHGAN